MEVKNANNSLILHFFFQQKLSSTFFKMIWIEYFNILNILNIEFVYCEKKITKLICTFLLWIHIDKNISKNEDYPLDANNFGYNLLLYCGRAKRGHTLYFSDFSHISFYSHFPMFDYITSIKISFKIRIIFFSYQIKWYLIQVPMHTILLTILVRYKNM